MNPAHHTSHEAHRLEVLRRYAVLESPPEAALDDLTALAARLCEAPMALISFVDAHRHWFKAKFGLETEELPRDLSLCVYALKERDLFVVPDAAANPRFARSPLVIGEPGIRFFASAPLIAPEGVTLGLLCVIDRAPRTLTPLQEQALRVLSRQVMAQLELRRRGLDLEASEGKLRAIFEAAPDCVKLLGTSAKLLEINAAGLRLIEAVNLEAVEGRCLLPLVEPEDRPAVEAMLQAAARGERSTVQYRIRGLKGTPRWLEMTAAPFHDSSGAHVLAISHDVTARKQSEEKIQRLHRLYAVSSSVNDAIVHLRDPQELYEQACRIAVEQGGLIMAWVGLIAADLVTLQPVARWGRDEGYLEAIRVLTTPQHREGQGPGGEAFRTGAPAVCNDIEADPGFFASRAEALRRGYRSCAAFPLKLEGRSIGMLAVYGGQPNYFDTEELRLLNRLAENISFAVESHRKEEQRRRAEMRCRRLVDSNAQGVMFWHLDGRITGANDAFLAMVRYTREDLEAGRISWSAMTPPEYAEVDRRAAEVLAATGICHALEKEYLRKDGTRVPVLIGAATLEGNAEEGVSFVIDLTERKELEHQFYRAQRMESIGTLAGGIAHDLNNVLSPIIMSLDVLKLSYPDHPSRELLSLISLSAQRGAEMVRQVLSFARGVEGRRMEVQLKHLIQDIEKIATDTFLKQTRVETYVPPGLWTVFGDPTQLHQVLLNLCVNARDAMPQGGRLTISAEHLIVDAHYAAHDLEAKPGPYVVVKVEDTGVGIAPEFLDKIFDPFFTTKSLGKGTGLGLSTSLGIVKSHGGFIRVQSELSAGTTFKVFLPAHPEGSAHVTTARLAEFPHGKGELILVVDDEAPVRTVTQHTLETFGYRVLAAADGAEAISIYAAHQSEIAAVITDMMMPIMDGRATIATLRKMNPAVRIIAASGLTPEASSAQSTQLGAHEFLAKPFTSETLLKTLRSVLSEKR